MKIDQQLFLLPTNITTLRTIEIDGYSVGNPGRIGCFRKTTYYECDCGKLLHYSQIVNHLASYHFYTWADAQFTMNQAKLGKRQGLATLANTLL